MEGGGGGQLKNFINVTFKMLLNGAFTEREKYSTSGGSQV